MDTYDDEEIPSSQEQSTVVEPKPFIDEKIKLTVINKNKAPLEATNFTVLLELKGNGSNEDTPGVDIVTVLDVSGSMGDDNKLQKMKDAMKFLMKKLSSNHRLSVVTFSSGAYGMSPLRWMTEKTQGEIGRLVDKLQAGGGNNIAGGLRMALDVLNRRKVSAGRVAAIILMSDGNQDTKYEDARNVPVGDVPVFTFGFGKGRYYNPEVLNTVAINSKATFSVVDVDGISESNYLNIAFAHCLGGLLTVVVQDLKLTVIRAKPDIVINGLSIKFYPIAEDADSRTISFGNLYNEETRSVLVDLNLPAVANEAGYDVFKIYYSYVYDGTPFEANPVTVIIVRTAEPVDEENEKVTTEKTRVDTVDKMQKATDFADEGKFCDAQIELKQAQDALERAALNFVIKVLKSQVAQLVDLMQNKQIYNDKGQHIALAILTSHYLQRAAAIGNVNILINAGFFDTPGGKALVLEAIVNNLNQNWLPILKPCCLPHAVSIAPIKPFKFEDIPVAKPKPNKPVVPFKPDQVEQYKKHPNPLDPIIEPLTLNIETAVDALKTIQSSLEAIQILLNSTKGAKV